MACRGCLALLLGLMIAATADAEPSSPAAPRDNLRMLDSTRSRAEFEVRVLWLMHIHGRFDEVYGSISTDRFHGTAKVDARIRANRVSMRLHSQEEWVKSAEFFDVQHFPEIYFVSDSFPLTRLDGGGDIDGNLTLRGITHRAHFQILPSACRGSAAQACATEVEGSVRRSDFGMRSRRGALSDTVDLSFSVFVAPDDHADSR